MPACSGNARLPSRKAGVLYHPRTADIAAANPYPVHRFTDSGRAYPHRAYSCRACHAAAAVCHSYSHLASHAAAACHSYPHLASSAAAAACHSFPHFAYFAAAALGYRSAARTATPPAWSEMPPRIASLLQFCPEHRHGPRPFSCSTRRRTADPRPCSARGTKKADGTAQRSVRRQKATNLSRQHHRGSSSTRQVSARA